MIFQSDRFIGNRDLLSAIQYDQHLPETDKKQLMFCISARHKYLLMKLTKYVSVCNWTNRKLMRAYLKYLQKDLDRSGLYQQSDDVMSSLSVNLGMFCQSK